MTSRSSTAPGSGKEVVALSATVSDGSTARTSLMRSAQTVARGIIIVMKEAMTIPMRICMR